MIKRKKAVLIFFGVWVISFIVVLTKPPHGMGKTEVTQLQLRVLSVRLAIIYEEELEFPEDMGKFIQHEVFQEYLAEREQYGATLKHIITDSWGEDFIYRRINENHVVLVSKGADQKLNTSDDIQFSAERKSVKNSEGN